MDLMGNVSGSISLGGGGAGGIDDVLVKKTTEYESIVDNNKAYLDLTWVASKADLADYVTLTDMEDYYDKIEVNGLLNDKQDKLTAGDNITINNNVISASGGVVYSTDEIVIGKWLDGKDLYQKTILYNNSVAARTVVTFDLANINIDVFLLNMNATFGKRNTGDAWDGQVWSATNNTDGQGFMVWWHDRTNDNIMCLRTNNYVMRDFTITINYTKTTD